MMKFKLENSFGFTVLELMTVTVIIVILLTMVLANFKGFDSDTSLDWESDKILSVLRQAQVWALTGQTVSGQRYNYGVHFQECSEGVCEYILFVDKNDNKQYDELSDERYGQVEYKISGGVFLDDNSLEIDSAYVDALDILFEAPLGEIYFNGSSDASDAYIYLTSDRSSNQKTISINQVSGRINIE